MATDFGQISFVSSVNPLFSTYNPYSNPDFSSAGAPIQVGFVPIVVANDQFQIVADYANLSFDIAPLVSVPEPAAVAPLILLLGGLVLGGFQRRLRVGSRAN
jgi:hypothetical protein